jgi:hypothetical protein
VRKKSAARRYRFFFQVVVIFLLIFSPPRSIVAILLPLIFFYSAAPGLFKNAVGAHLLAECPSPSAVPWVACSTAPVAAFPNLHGAPFLPQLGPRPAERLLPRALLCLPWRARAPWSAAAPCACRGSLLQLAPSSPRGSHGVLLYAERLFPTAPSNPVFLCSRGPRPCFPSLAELAGSLSPSSMAGRAQRPPLSFPRAPACSLLGSVTAPCAHLLCARAPSLFLQTSRAPPSVRTELLPYAGRISLVLAQSGAANGERNSRVPLRAATSSRSACSGSEAGHPVCSALPCRKTPTPSSLAAHREVPCCQPPHLS